MDKYAIEMADAVIRRYHTRDPFEIISHRKVKLRDMTRFKNLLGYYMICNGVDYIGINRNATEAQQYSACAHEVGHLFLDRESARTGTAFQDTFFYSTDNGRCERRANTFGSELTLSDEFVLERIGYYAYEVDRRHLEAQLSTRCSAEYRLRRYDELIQSFYYEHPEIASNEEIAREAGVEPHYVDFKLNILNEKGFEIPKLPDLKSDFLKDCMKNK